MNRANFRSYALGSLRGILLVAASVALAACATPPSQLGQIQRLPSQATPDPVIVQTDANQLQRDADISAQILSDQVQSDQLAAASRAAEHERQRIANEWAWFAYPAPYAYSPYWLGPAWGWGGHINYGFGGHGRGRGGVWLGF
jgi:hypothetical protein